MPAVSGSGALTRSQVESWDVEHLEAAATHFSSTAGVWEEHYTAIHEGTSRPGGTEWTGPAADAAAERTWGDLVKVRGTADGLYAAASIAREGAGDLWWARGQVLESIGEAEAAQFEVGEDLSVRDRTMTSLMRGWEARQAQAEVFAAEIASRAKTLAAIDQQVAGRLITALAPVRDVSFAETPAVQAAGYRFKTDVQDGDHDPFTGGDNHKPQVKTPLPPQFDPNTGAANGPGGGPLGKFAEGELESPAAASEGLDITTAHARSLGMDPATGGFRASESETALRVERQLGVNLTRAGTHDGYDWVDATGKTYDAVGNFSSKFFDAQWPTLQGRIMDHLAKADIVPVDVSQFTAAQREVVLKFVEGLNNSRVIVIGAR